VLVVERAQIGVALGGCPPDGVHERRPRVCEPRVVAVQGNERVAQLGEKRSSRRWNAPSPPTRSRTRSNSARTSGRIA
jgi:hypothetical protein